MKNIYITVFAVFIAVSPAMASGKKTIEDLKREIESKRNSGADETIIGAPQVPAPVSSSPAGPAATVNPEIKKAEDYLNGLTTVTADFIQAAPDGAVSGGKFYLSRPGRLRWDYAPPVKLLVLADGSHLIYHDKELEEISYVSLDDTLAAFLATPEISLSGPVTVVKSSNSKGVVSVTIVKTGKKEDGSLTMFFTENPMKLKKMEIADASGQVTSITLSNMRLGMPLSDRLFVAETNAGGKRRK